MKILNIFCLLIILNINLFSNELIKIDKIENEVNQEKLNELNNYFKTINFIEQYYVDDLKYKEIIQKSLNGLLKELDLHSEYLNAEELINTENEAKGEFAGIGIKIDMVNDLLKIISPIPDSPAAKIGLKPHDIIVKINDIVIKNMKYTEIVDLLKGEEGSTVKLTISRSNVKNDFLDFIVERKIVKLNSVDSYVIKDRNNYIAYFVIKTFDQNVAPRILIELKKMNNLDIKGYILDVRNNPGGLLEQAIQTADLFLEEGVIVSEKGRHKDFNNVFSATKSNIELDKPLVVLVNEGSASASEILAGALQDNKRAVLVGKPTYGKGSVQMIKPINDKEAIKLTVARYYLPSGRTIQSKGVIPDIHSNFGPVTTNKSKTKNLIKENEYSNTIKVKKYFDKLESEREFNSEKKHGVKFVKEKDIVGDNQLNDAINSILSIINYY